MTDCLWPQDQQADTEAGEQQQQRRISWAFNLMIKPDGKPDAKALAEGLMEAAVASQEDLLDSLLDEL